MEITLIRHGKPKSADNLLVNASGYAKWIRHYNFSDVALNSRPESIEQRFKSFYSISSDLIRAVHSANIYLDEHPKQIDKLYREMEIPRYKLPFTLKTWHWVFVTRVLWMAGLKGVFESFSEGKKRADVAADELIEIARSKDKVILFGHGYMNRYIRKSPIKKGWQLNVKSNKYWGVTNLVLKSTN